MLNIAKADSRANAIKIRKKEGTYTEAKYKTKELSLSG